MNYVFMLTAELFMYRLKIYVVIEFILVSYDARGRTEQKMNIFYVQRRTMIIVLGIPMKIN